MDNKNKSLIISSVFFFAVVVTYFGFLFLFPVISKSNTALIASLGVLICLSIVPVFYLLKDIRYAFISDREYLYTSKEMMVATDQQVNGLLANKFQDAFSIVIAKTNELKSLNIMDIESELLQLILKVEGYVEYLNEEIEQGDKNPHYLQLLHLLEKELGQELLLIQGLSKMVLRDKDEVDLSIIEDTYNILYDKLIVIKQQYDESKEI